MRVTALLMIFYMDQTLGKEAVVLAGRVHWIWHLLMIVQAKPIACTECTPASLRSGLWREAADQLKKFRLLKRYKQCCRCLLL
jgi:hypothetical protein